MEDRLLIVTDLVIGLGEVGKALAEVLARTYDLARHDLEILPPGHYDHLHVCFPYGEGFEASVKYYQDRYTAEHTIIHSTVPVGTSRALNALHSPVHGLHPNLISGLQTFPKYVGGVDYDEAYQIVKYFQEAGIPACQVADPETSELSKLLCTTYYGWNILFEKEAHRLCEKYQVNWETVYQQWNRDYNEGYEELGYGQYRRPVLKHMPGPIGGHCIVPNAKLLPGWLAKTFLDRHRTYEAEQGA